MMCDCIVDYFRGPRPMDLQIVQGRQVGLEMCHRLQNGVGAYAVIDFVVAKLEPNSSCTSSIESHSKSMNEKTLALMVPHDQPVLGISKKNFVDLLEFAEDKLEMERVLAVFEKDRINPTEGFPRTLRYVGFRPYAIDEHPECLPSDKYFIMSYKV
uniref:Ornithine decarboxylase antizyme n=1 Tax=Caenorhabditis tropicalis TaxID=1561998 RepID=A0A1I7UG99_9PELO